MTVMLAVLIPLFWAECRIIEAHIHLGPDL